MFLAAAKVGGILANDHLPGGLPLRDNLLIELNVIDAAYRHGVRSSYSWEALAFTPSLRPNP